MHSTIISTRYTNLDLDGTMADEAREMLARQLNRFWYRFPEISRHCEFALNGSAKVHEKTKESLWFSQCYNSMKAQFYSFARLWVLNCTLYWTVALNCNWIEFFFSMTLCSITLNKRFRPSVIWSCSSQETILLTSMHSCDQVFTFTVLQHEDFSQQPQSIDCGLWTSKQFDMACVVINRADECQDFPEAFGLDL